VLVPGAGEMLAQDVAQRMLADIESFAIDDGRGAVLQVTISIGMVTWQPQQYPAVDMPRLAVQMESVGSKALESAKSRGGNCVAQARLSTMIS
jgi:GGDEF domain-containing protein